VIVISALDIGRAPARLASFRAALAREPAKDEAFDRLARMAQATLNVPAAVFSLIDEDRVVFKSVHGSAWSAQAERPLHLSFCQYVLNEPEGLQIEDAARDPRVADNPVTHEFGVRGYLGFPLMVRGHAVGAFALIDHEPRVWTAEQVKIANDIALCAASELELRASLRDREEAHARGQILYGLTAALSRGEPLAAIYERAFDALAALLHAPRSAVLLFDATGTMRFQAWRGLSDEYRAAVDGHSPWKRDDRQPAPLLVPDVETDPQWAAYLPVFRSERVRALGFLPIALGDELLGKFMVYYTEPHAFSQSELQLAQTISAHIATGIARFRTEMEREEAREGLLVAHRRASALQQITAAFAAARSAAEVVDVVLTRGLDVLGASAGAILELDATGHGLEIVKSVAYGDELLQRYGRVPLHAHIPVADAVRRREPLFLGSREELLRAYPNMVDRQPDIAASEWAAVPLEVSGRVLGAFVMSRSTGRPFDADQRAFIRALGQQCAQALDRKHTERRREQRGRIRQIENEVLRAHALGSPLGEVMSALALRIEELAPGALVAVSLLDPDGIHLRHGAAPSLPAAYSQAVDGAPIGPRAGSCGTAAFLKERVIVEDTLSDPLWGDYRELAASHSLRACWSLPVIASGSDRVLGTFAIYHREPRRPSAEEFELLEALRRTARLVIETDAAQRALREAEERIRLAVEAAAVGTWDLDPIARVLTWDDACRAMFGLSAGAETSYEMCGEAVHPEDRERAAAAAQRALDGADGGKYAAEFRAIGIEDGVERWLAAKGQVIFDAARRPRRFIGTIADISEPKRAAIERERLIEDLNRAVRFSEVFTGILAHDLRNPLDAITMTAGALLRREDSERIAKPISRVLHCADRMTRMIDQLLDFTHVRLGGGIPLERAPVDLGEVCREVVDELENVYLDRAIRIEQGGDLRGRWDRDRLAQLLSNLGANACEHGREATRVLVRATGLARDLVEIEVHNDGVIAPELIADIFEPLRSGKTGGRSSGLGLGLYISQQVAEAHGGTIVVESSAEEGTRFVVRLPRS
jgi:PAS domain S-box-containing protein